MPDNFLTPKDRAALEDTLKKLIRWLSFDYDPAVDWGLPLPFGQRFRDASPLDQQAQQCPSLTAMNVRQPNSIATIIRQAHIMRGWGFAAIFLTLALLIGVGIAIPKILTDGIEAYWWLCFPLLISIVALASYVRYRTRLAMQQALITELFRLVILLEKNPAEWMNADFIRNINRRLEACARQIESLPLIMGLRHDALSRSQVAVVAAQAAAQFRSYKVWVVQPGPFTFTDLVERLVLSLELLLRGRWFDLPSSSIQAIQRSSKLARTGWIVLFVGVLGLLLALGYWQQTIGSAVSATGAAVLGVLLTFILSRLGIRIAAQQQAAEVSAKIFPSGK